MGQRNHPVQHWPQLQEGRVELLDSRDFKNAIVYFEKGYALNPRDGGILFALAFTYHISNQLSKAIKYYNKVGGANQTRWWSSRATTCSRTT
jgi:tetratricopeptide (TPR) repeat protein